MISSSPVSRQKPLCGLPVFCERPPTVSLLLQLFCGVLFPPLSSFLLKNDSGPSGGRILEAPICPSVVSVRRPKKVSMNRREHVPRFFGSEVETIASSRPPPPMKASPFLQGIEDSLLLPLPFSGPFPLSFELVKISSCGKSLGGAGWLYFTPTITRNSMTLVCEPNLRLPINSSLLLQP